MHEITSSPKLHGLRRIALVALDAHGLYSQFGFTLLNEPDIFTEKWNLDVCKMYIKSLAKHQHAKLI